MIGLTLSLALSFILNSLVGEVIFVAYSICISYFLVSTLYICYYYKIVKTKSFLNVLFNEILPIKFLIPLLLFFVILYVNQSLLFISPLLLIILNISVLKDTVKIIKNEKN
jgi:hypothetical protein